MKIQINGKEKTYPNNPMTILNLLQDLNLTPEMIVVEKNKTIINKDNYPTDTVQDKDSFELIQFMGGG